MASTEQIENELRQYIEDAHNLSKEDRYIHLKAIFDKHFTMEKTEHLLTISDFQSIISYAKYQFINTDLPVKISKRDVYPHDVGNVLVIEAIIAYLNKSKLLRRVLKIDYTK